MLAALVCATTGRAVRMHARRLRHAQRGCRGNPQLAVIVPAKSEHGCVLLGLRGRSCGARCNDEGVVAAACNRPRGSPLEALHEARSTDGVPLQTCAALAYQAWHA